jgi:hypothetical protein
MRLLATASALLATVGATKTGTYRNENYLYSVRLPRNIEYEVSDPPAPNHGLGIRLAGSASVWVDASYTDARNLNEAISAERELWETYDRCRLVLQEKSRLAGMAASLLSFRCDQTPDHPAQRMRVLFAVCGARPHRGPIQYTVRMEYASAGEEKAARRAFEMVTSNFKLIGR